MKCSRNKLYAVKNVQQAVSQQGLSLGSSKMLEGWHLYQLLSFTLNSKMSKGGGISFNETCLLGSSKMIALI